MEHIKLTKEKLKKLIEQMEEGEQLDCFLLTNIGRSSKTFIKVSAQGFDVIHEIDNTYTIFSCFREMMLSKKTNIPEAIKNGRFYLYEYEAKNVENIK